MWWEMQIELKQKKKKKKIKQKKKKQSAEPLDGTASLSVRRQRGA